MREGHHCWDPWNMFAKKRTSPFDWKSHCQASQGQTFMREPSLSQSTLLNHGISIVSPRKTRRDMKNTGLIASSFCNLNKQLHKSNSLSGMEFFCPPSYQAQAPGQNSASRTSSEEDLVQLCTATSLSLFILLSLKESSQNSQIGFKLFLKGKRETAEVENVQQTKQLYCEKKLWKNILYNGNYDRLNNECHQCDGTKHTILFPTQIFAGVPDFLF